MWGKIRRQVESNVGMAQASAAELAGARLSARTQLAIAYFNLRASDSLEQILHDTVVQYRRTYEITPRPPSRRHCLGLRRGNLGHAARHCQGTGDRRQGAARQVRARHRGR
ncbi:MAG: hypothetical protein WDN31_02100 [Hyphomicrobium sp.]